MFINLFEAPTYWYYQEIIAQMMCKEKLITCLNISIHNKSFVTEVLKVSDLESTFCEKPKTCEKICISVVKSGRVSSFFEMDYIIANKARKCWLFVIGGYVLSM